MLDNGARIATAVGAVIAVVLQLVLAPNIMIASAVPNFLLAYVVVIAIARAQECGFVLPFVLGLFFDLLGGGPVGASALLYLIATFLLSAAFKVLDNDSLFMPFVLIVVTILLVELVYGVIIGATGAFGFFEALVYRSLPCTVYSCVFGIIMYPLVLRFVAQRGNQMPSSPLIG